MYPLPEYFKVAMSEITLDKGDDFYPAYIPLRLLLPLSLMTEGFLFINFIDGLLFAMPIGQN